MARRRASGDERLFPDVKCRESLTTDGKPDFDWSHYPSKALNRIIDDAVTTDPSIVPHSLRHGFRTRAENADVADPIIDAIAGWTQKTVGRRYGEREIPMLAANLARLDFGALRL